MKRPKLHRQKGSLRRRSQSRSSTRGRGRMVVPRRLIFFTGVMVKDGEIGDPKHSELAFRSSSLE
jgi:hypothetical protein